mmetsp:Transcript_31394/g.56892  ORF Transcript_31394/g.56892 Transcript_31394/m.56892 type:complete len:1558 (-) Transcript_31394:161-4834(-)|eukprot:CAMPEP_0197675896 /NCGR_PEP_ID=MMETSP1338-20131121/85786_1 /TAXON_ID=43686 ORGANISM="Pelagodinium beii, Strain RCC1491" /NCGR_SAMPLE_ID=MMETSP1338 /ASSEMBLY_ACC=CAM_ASM_000754 /LENGTH=1557 /DNA_ID=CAMNT_0043256503 /DNA_START=37 /DNA_END=4710 /DNA_ORIENTATION=-
MLAYVFILQVLCSQALLDGLAEFDCQSDTCLADLENEEAALIDVQLLQTSLRVNSLRSTQQPEHGPDHHDEVISKNGTSLVAEAIPGLASHSLLVQMAAVKALRDGSPKTHVEIVLPHLSDNKPLSIASAYFTLYVLSVISMVYCMNVGSKPLDVSVIKKVDAVDDPIKEGILSWLGVTWLNPIVARLGNAANPATSKCIPEDLPDIGMQHMEAVAKFEELWLEEVNSVGEAKASLNRVMVKLWTFKKMALFTFLIGIRVIVGSVFSVLLIQHSLSYFAWLSNYVADHGELPDMTNPMLASIGCFSVLPLSTILITSQENVMLAKMDRQLIGVVVYIFKKTQRLPAASLGVEVERSGKDADSATKKPNALSTINIDLVSNFHGVAYSVALLFNSCVSACILICLLVSKLGFATLFSLAVAVPGLVFSAIMTGGLAVSLMQYQGLMDKRSTSVREILQGIRVVKCCAWEEAMERKISELRSIEIGCLISYFRTTGAFVCFFSTFPRCLTIAGLAGFTFLYGQHDLATIFAIVQILASLRSCCDMFASSMMRVVNLGPSAARVEQYLKLEEAPVLPGVRVPSWVQMWPHPAQVSSPSPEFKLHGSFAFTSKSTADTILHDLKLNVPQGQMVGIVGAVGSGKSTLLQAALGELHPVQSGTVPPSLSRPLTCAYCPQVPHIAEGTLRDNVLFGEPYDEERYAQAIAMAALEKDLELLPGGDGALIGARGISLSGGQRARVALARAAYHQHAELALIDDPFGSLDAPTGTAVLERLLCGPLMSSRTRLVALQPEMERLQRFDWVLVMSKGRVVASGKPEDIVRADEFKLLQSSSASSAGDSSPGQIVSEIPVARKKIEPVLGTTLREDECEVRPTWQMMADYCCMGRWRNLINGMLLYCVTLMFYLFCDLSLANWTDAMAHDPSVSAKTYLQGYLFWLVAATLTYYLAWKFGEYFSIRISASSHTKILKRLLGAPIDRFFDKQPLGRLMNRLTTDMAALDLSMYTRLIGCVMSLLGNAMPLIYIHFIMPWFITVLAIPFYVAFYKIYMLYQNSSVPMRYCTLTSISRANNLVSDIMANGLVVRGLGQEQRLIDEFARCTGDANKASLMEERFLKRWVMNRLTYLWSFYNTSVFIAGLFNVSSIGAGQLGLCLTNLLLIEAMLDTTLMVVSGTIFQLVSLARLHEYMGVGQERPAKLLQDAPLDNYFITCPQKSMAEFTMKEADGAVEVLRRGEPFLRSSEDGRTLLLCGDKEFKMQDICPSCTALGQVGKTHHLVAANNAVGSAKQIAEELCKGKKTISASSFSKPKEMKLEFKSSWLADGARVDVEDLHVGYADMPQNVLKGVSFSLAPKMKAAIVGTTGCGKSSLLLALLRVLEPRAGRVRINSVDTQEIGLATLRSSLGLVPQEPILFSGTLRHNLDPFDQFTDGRLRQVVKQTHLEQFIQSLPLGLDHMVSDEGGNLSFGQRQLLCLARMVLRQPALLLLDEATSAIDPHTQELVQETLDEAFPVSTQIAVAHRLETILKFDHVVVLDKGVVAEQGSVKDLTQLQDGHFTSMLKAKGL